MLQAQYFLAACQGTAIERLRFEVVTLGAKNERKVAEHHECLRMLRAQSFLATSQRPTKERLRCGVVTGG